MSVSKRLPLRFERLEDRVMLSFVPSEVVVMSENLYMGADPVPIITASVLGNNFFAGPALTQLAVTNFWNDVQATNFPKRADAIVQQIADQQPDLIGLQEVMTYYSGVADSMNGNATQANTVELDFLSILQSKLAAKGLKYQSFVQPLGDFEAPGYVNGNLRDLRLVDSVVILARSDLPASQVSFGTPQGGKFNESISFSQTLLGPLQIDRGWNSIDVSWGNSQFRFINMCLETPVFPLTQAIQGAEILLGPAFTTKPVILVGDSNSDGANPSKPFSVFDNTFTYSMLTADYGAFVPGVSLHDAWTQTHVPSEPGYTWGNQPDLQNTQPMSYQPWGMGPYRMDLILHRDLFQATSMKRLGVDAQTRADLGMWPSDHAGVVATLAIQTPVSSAADLGVSSFLATWDPSWAILNEQLERMLSSQTVISETNELREPVLRSLLLDPYVVPGTIDSTDTNSIRIACESAPQATDRVMEWSAWGIPGGFDALLEDRPEFEEAPVLEDDSMATGIWEAWWEPEPELLDAAVHALLAP